MKDRLKILNIWVDPINRNDAIRRVRRFLSIGTRPHAILASNPEKNFSVPKDSILYDTFKNSDILLPDGIGVVLATRILYGVNIERLPGSEFIFDICNLAAKEHYKIFIFGSKEEVNKKAAEELMKRFPGLKITGRANGYIKESEMLDLIDKINESKAEILFLALGSPKQEKWYANYKEHLKHVRIVQGVGGTFDTIVGTVKRAPKAWCKLQLEWLYRLITEPKRIQRQIVLPVFGAMIMIKKFEKIFKNRQ